METSIGATIAAARHKKGLTQDQLAKLTDISRSYICDVEKDRYHPSVRTITRIAKPLELDLNFLLKMTEIQDMPPPKKGA